MRLQKLHVRRKPDARLEADITVRFSADDLSVLPAQIQDSANSELCSLRELLRASKVTFGIIARNLAAGCENPLAGIPQFVEFSDDGALPVTDEEIHHSLGKVLRLAEPDRAFMEKILTVVYQHLKSGRKFQKQKISNAV